MRVLLTTDSVGGVWDHSVTLAAALRRRGHEAVLAHVGPPPRPAQRQQAARRRIPLLIGSFPLEWTPGGLDEAQTCRRWLRRIASQVHADVIHCNSYSHIDPFTKVPQVLAAHSTLHGWWDAVHGERPPAWWEPYRRVVRDAVRTADAVVAPSAAMLDELRRLYGDCDGRVVHNGVQAPPVTTPPAPGAARQEFVLAGGRLWDEGKGHRVLDRAAAGIPWPVRVTGSLNGPEHTVTFHNLEPLGFLSRDALERNYDAAGLYANPALYEPFGLGALEAATRGCPLLLSDLPSHRELWGDAALLVPAGDPDAWRDAAVALIHDPARRDALAHAARRHAGRYDDHSMAIGYSDLYRSLAGTAAPRTGGAESEVLA